MSGRDDEGIDSQLAFLTTAIARELPFLSMLFSLLPSMVGIEIEEVMSVVSFDFDIFPNSRPAPVFLCDSCCGTEGEITTGVGSSRLNIDEVPAHAPFSP